MCLSQVRACGSATRTSGTSAAGAPASYEESMGLAGGGGLAGYEELFPAGSLPGEAYRSPTFSFCGPLWLVIRRVERDGEQKLLVPQEASVQHTLTGDQLCCFSHGVRALFAVHQSAPPISLLPQCMLPSMGFDNPC